MRHRLLSALLPLAAVTFAAPSSAKEVDRRQALDPNETVCENEEVLGSRLAIRRICLTRAQWTEKRRDDRALVDRSQTQLCIAIGGKCTKY